MIGIALAAGVLWGIFWWPMKTGSLLPLAIAALALFAAAPAYASPEYPKMGPDIYDVHADGNAQIAAALDLAKAQNKRVILDFGANWCIWCRRLHAIFEEDPSVSKALGAGYVVVMVDVNTRNGVKRDADVKARYVDPKERGIPYIVVLGPDGRRLATENTEDFGDDSAYDPAKVLAFVKAWAPAGR